MRLLHWFSNIVDLSAIFVYFCTLLLRPLKNWEMAACHPWCSFLNHHRKSHIDWETFLYFSVSAVEKKRGLLEEKTCIFASPTPPLPPVDHKSKAISNSLQKVGLHPKRVGALWIFGKSQKWKDFRSKAQIRVSVFPKILNNVGIIYGVRGYWFEGKQMIQNKKGVVDWNAKYKTVNRTFFYFIPVRQ